jgi:hypothetical protein
VCSGSIEQKGGGFIYPPTPLVQHSCTEVLGCFQATDNRHTPVFQETLEIAAHDRRRKS